MANKKISELVAASEMFVNNETVIVQGGVDKRCAKSVILSGATGEDVVLHASAGQVARIEDVDASAYWSVEEDEEITAQCESLSIHAVGSGFDFVNILINPFGRIKIESDGDQDVMITSHDETTYVKINPSDGLVEIVAANNYVYGGNFLGTSWSGSAPVELQAAIQRCATLLKTLNGGVGP